MTGDRIRLGRSLAGRVAGGALFQLVLGIVAIVLLIRAIVPTSGSHGSSELTTLVVGLVALALWLLGVTAYAEADAEGIRWRYYLPHRVRWSEIERISLVLVNMGWRDRHLIVVRASGEDHRIIPASACGPGRTEFARQLLSYASTQGVATANEGWVRGLGDTP